MRLRRTAAAELIERAQHLQNVLLRRDVLRVAGILIALKIRLHPLRFIERRASGRLVTSLAPVKVCPSQWPKDSLGTALMMNKLRASSWDRAPDFSKPP